MCLAPVGRCVLHQVQPKVAIVFASCSHRVAFVKSGLECASVGGRDRRVMRTRSRAGNLARVRRRQPAEFHPGDRVVCLDRWPLATPRTATLIRRKRWLGQRAWLVEMDGSRLRATRAGSVRTTVTERVMRPAGK